MEKQYIEKLRSLPMPEKGKESTAIFFEDELITVKGIVSNDYSDDELYLQSSDERVTLLEGEAVLGYADGCTVLFAGDSIFIPKGKKHRVVEAKRCYWLCIYYKG